MTLVGLAARKLAQKQRTEKLAAAFPNGIRCQKCLQKGHWSYECREKRKYVHRSSRTKQLKKHLTQKEANKIEATTADETQDGISCQNKKVKRRRKRQTSSSSSSSSSSASSSSSKSSSGSSSSSGSTDTDSSDSTSDSQDDSSSEEDGSAGDSSSGGSSSDTDSDDAHKKTKKRRESSNESEDIGAAD
ncbi:zinc finger CCHC domain-containing protein 10 [Drosophila tropicalis]|uniref:zinc finger CCHC domain-containing protein 10 n=1 Tax=Drosophila tropicalis TaxID=46794 RepID=UPI0035ABAAF8